MRIIVCIKPVPDTEAINRVRIDPQTGTLVREGIPSIINPFDENAVEEALRIKERRGGEVICLSMGPPQAKEALRKALALGVDEAILLSDPLFAGSDTLATSYTLSQGIRKIGKFDLILTGKQAIDGDTAQVGPGLAEWLGIPQLTFVRKIEVGEGKIKAERTLEDSYELVEVPLPCLITVTKEINTPRYPSLKGILRAKKKEIQVWTSKDLPVEEDKLGLDGSPTRVIRVFTPPPPRGGEILSGSLSEQAEKLLKELEKRSLI